MASTSREELVAENERLRRRVAELEVAGSNALHGAGQPSAANVQRISSMYEVLSSTLDLEHSIEQIAGMLLDVFDCDRAWMLHPCDPKAATWRVPIEVCTAAWPSALPVGQDLPMHPGHARILASVIASEGPVVMDQAQVEAEDPELVSVHSIRSQMMALVKSDVGKPWILGLHQCSHERLWTEAEKGFFQSIAERLGQLLSNLLAHKDLEQREERLKLALDAVQDGAWDWNIVSGELLFSESWALLLGYDPAEIDPHVRSWNQLLHPEDVPGFEADWQAHLEGVTDAFRCEHRMRTKSGEWRWVLDRGKVVERSADGKPLRATGTQKDISAAKEAQLLLQRERLLFTGGPCVVFRWVAADDWPVEYVSPNVMSFLGYSAEDFMTGRVKYGRIIHPDDRERVTAEVRAYSASEAASFEQEYRIVRPSGEVRWLYDFTVVHREDGEITHYEGYVLDATERKEGEAKRMALEAQVQQAQKLESLGVLAGGIAHDFNNLLMGVLGHADLAMGTLPVSSPAVKNVRGIMDAAKQAAELTHQMLAYSGKGRFLVESLSVNSVIEEMTRLLEVTISKTAILRVDLAPNLPAVEADGSQIRQVIMNLITNAAEAVGDRSGVVSIRTGAMQCDREYLDTVVKAQEMVEGNYVFVEVADTGCGMDEVTLSKIFDPFFTTKFTGRGLGLAAVQGIVRGHSGAIRVYSEPQRGTTFKVLLPACSEPAQGAQAKSALPSWTGTGTILLVDDEETVRTIGTLMLQRLGFDVVTASDGPTALDVFRKDPDDFACVILDLTMPHMHGDEVFRELRRIDDGVRVLLSSGYNHADIVQRFSGKGLAGFIQKPYGRDELAKALELALA